MLSLCRLFGVTCFLFLVSPSEVRAEESQDLIVRVSANTQAIHQLCRELARFDSSSQSAAEIEQAIDSLAHQTEAIEALLNQTSHFQNSRLQDEVSQSSHALQLLRLRIERSAV